MKSGINKSALNRKLYKSADKNSEFREGKMSDGFFKKKNYPKKTTADFFSVARVPTRRNRRLVSFLDRTTGKHRNGRQKGHQLAYRTGNPVTIAEKKSKKMLKL